jgi:hypothetical protein
MVIEMQKSIDKERKKTLWLEMEMSNRLEKEKEMTERLASICTKRYAFSRHYTKVSYLSKLVRSV